MIRVTDKDGNVVFVDYIHDCGSNVGGFYCQTYSDERGDNKIDDFCIHPEDCDCSNYDEVEDYIRHYYENEVLDLNYVF